MSTCAEGKSPVLSLCVCVCVCVCCMRGRGMEGACVCVCVLRTLKHVTTAGPARTQPAAFRHPPTRHAAVTSAGPKSGIITPPKVLFPYSNASERGGGRAAQDASQLVHVSGQGVLGLRK